MQETETKRLLAIDRQIGELRTLEPGWYEGGGSSPSAPGLDWLLAWFGENYPDGWDPPLLYPMPDGGIYVEWFILSNDATLSINLETRTGDYHNLNFSTRNDDYREGLDLDSPLDVAWLLNRLRLLSPKTGSSVAGHLTLAALKAEVEKVPPFQPVRFDDGWHPGPMLAPCREHGNCVMFWAEWHGPGATAKTVLLNVGRALVGKDADLWPGMKGMNGSSTVCVHRSGFDSFPAATGEVLPLLSARDAFNMSTAQRQVTLSTLPVLEE